MAGCGTNRGGGAESTRKNIRKCIQTWRNKEDKLRDAIRILNWSDIRYAGHIEKMDGKKLLNCLIVSMLKRMPRKCEECGDWYSEFEEVYHKISLNLDV